MAPQLGYTFGEHGTAWFYRICPECHLFVRATEAALLTSNSFGDPEEVVAYGDCKRHGIVEMPFIGWFEFEEPKAETERP